MLFGFVLKFLGGVWGVREKCRNTQNRFLKKVYSRLYYRALAKSGSWIGLTAEFASDPIFPHLLGVFISGGAKIGRDCVIFHHVTIGSNLLPGSKKLGVPTIGDRCYIGAGAIIVGKVVIGDNVRIGAGCVVASDVPSNSVVVPPPPRVIQKESLENRHYTQRDGKWVYFENGKPVEVTDRAILDTFENM